MCCTPEALLLSYTAASICCSCVTHRSLSFKCKRLEKDLTEYYAKYTAYEMRRDLLNRYKSHTE